MELWERDLRETLLRKRGRMCEICGKRLATEFHHCLIRDVKKPAKLHRLLTCEENGQMVCGVCHTSLKQTANSLENKKKFAEMQIQRGYDIGKWARSLPLRYVEKWLLDL